MGRKKQDPAKRKSEYIDAAIALFCEKGCANTSLSELLAALGGDTPLSPGVFYYYFKSKDALLDECLNTYVDRYAEGMVRSFGDESVPFPCKVRQVLGIIRTAICDVGLMLPEGNADMDVSFHNLLSERFFRKILPPLSKLIAEGLESGALPRTELAAKAGPELMARLLCNGVATLLHKDTLLLPGAQHELANVRFVPAYVAQVLGLPLSAIEQP